MVEMEEMDAALKNLLVVKAKATILVCNEATVTAILIIATTSGVEQTTVVLSLGMDSIAVLSSE